MPCIHIHPLTQWITQATLQHSASLPAHLMQRLGISRRQAGQVLRKLVVLQWLDPHGSARKPIYRPGPLRQVVQRYALAGLHEDLPWRRDFAPAFNLPAHVQQIAQHAFTELLNNAVDHSGGSAVTVSVRQTPLQLQLLVSDDGCGRFQRIAQSFDIQDSALAMLELSKGKLTSAPDRHSGHGLYFTSRLADVFDIHANAAAYQCRGWAHNTWRAGKAGPVASRSGTSIYLAIATDTLRTLDAVLKAHSGCGQGHGFARTAVPLQLMGGGVPDAHLASRANARRAVQRLAQIRHAEIDFAGIGSVGHGFADEMFRGFHRQHPALDLVPVGMNPQVAAMVSRVRSGAA